MMLPSLFTLPTTEFAAAHYKSEPAIYGRAPAFEPPWPLRQVGTGGVATELFVRNSFGYQAFIVLEAKPQVEDAPYAKLMLEVKSGFGRTLSRLPDVFGVSRQTLYNWLGGETPKPVHQERLKQLADAANVFAELGFRPTSLELDRTVAQGKSFLELLADGADGKETAKKLVRIVQRGKESRAKLDELLGDRKANLTSEDIGAPSLNEEA